MMKMNGLIETTVGADLSCPLPIYRLMPVIFDVHYCDLDK